MKAFIGSPSKRNGEQEVCARCDRVARVRVGGGYTEANEDGEVFSVKVNVLIEHNVDPKVLGEPRCSWHFSGKLGGEGLNIARAAKTARKVRLVK